MREGRDRDGERRERGTEVIDRNGLIQIGFSFILRCTCRDYKGIFSVIILFYSPVIGAPQMKTLSLFISIFIQIGLSFRSTAIENVIAFSFPCAQGG